MKKYIAEVFGTFVLVLFGYGAAVVTSGHTAGWDVGFAGVFTIAAAFGLAIVAAAYAIGDISGCHVNPAVSLAVYLDGRMSLKDLGGYMVAQVLGALAGSSLLYILVEQSETLTGTGANGYGALSAVGLSMTGALIIEIVLTFVFVLTILRVTANPATNSLAGLVIGFTLTFVHILGIPLTGTSVNPARSLGPALFTGGEALGRLWVFILAPLVGAALAALFYRLLYRPEHNA